MVHAVCFFNGRSDTDSDFASGQVLRLQEQVRKYREVDI
jgi:hypothetical protein